MIHLYLVETIQGVTPAAVLTTQKPEDESSIAEEWHITVDAGDEETLTRAINEAPYT